MRNILVFMLTGLFVLVSLTGCATTAPAKTQLQMREFQTRNFETTDDKAVLKALVNVLQDDGYIAVLNHSRAKVYWFNLGNWKYFFCRMPLTNRFLICSKQVVHIA